MYFNSALTRRALMACERVKKGCLLPTTAPSPSVVVHLSLSRNARRGRVHLWANLSARWSDKRDARANTTHADPSYRLRSRVLRIPHVESFPYICGNMFNSKTNPSYEIYKSLKYARVSARSTCTNSTLADTFQVIRALFIY